MFAPAREPVLKFVLQPLLVLSQFLNCSLRYQLLFGEPALREHHDDRAHQEIKAASHYKTESITGRLAEICLREQSRDRKSDRHVEKSKANGCDHGANRDHGGATSVGICLLLDLHFE